MIGFQRFQVLQQIVDASGFYKDFLHIQLLQLLAKIIVQGNASQYDNPGARPDLADFLDALQPVHHRQGEIHDDEIVAFLANKLERFFPRSGSLHFMIVTNLENLTHCVENVPLIINQKDIHNCPLASSMTGKNAKPPDRCPAHFSVMVITNGERGIRTLDPRYHGYTLSKRAPSTTRTSLQIIPKPFS